MFCFFLQNIGLKSSNHFICIYLNLLTSQSLRAGYKIYLKLPNDHISLAAKNLDTQT